MIISSSYKKQTVYMRKRLYIYAHLAVYTGTYSIYIINETLFKTKGNHTARLVNLFYTKYLEIMVEYILFKHIFIFFSANILMLKIESVLYL